MIPTPKALEKALTESAARAQRLAEAFGLSVPVEPRKPTRASVHK
ncbi:MAG: hypothetical protein QM750_30695 [Rubrivivax sp.]